ncbi:MAG: hypothetical protein ACRDSF_17485 [Pseudonocardiaceae bacterium]
MTLGDEECFAEGSAVEVSSCGVGELVALGVQLHRAPAGGPAHHLRRGSSAAASTTTGA